MPDYNAIQKAYNKINQTVSTPEIDYPNLTTSQISSEGRYPIYHFGLDNENIYAQNQGTFDKWRNGAGKFLGLASTTLLEGTVGLANGVYQWINDGKFSSFYDNSFNRSLDEFNKKLENSLPNYYSAAERDAAWYSPKTWGTANFWSDTILKNSGFAVGAILSGGVWGKAISPLVNGIAKGVTRGAASEIATITQEAAQTGKSIADVNLQVAQVIKNANALKSKINLGANVARAGLATFGEASIEALHASQEYKERLKAEYQDRYGVEATGEDLAQIESTADEIGNWTFAANTALLTATNYIQFPKLMNTFWKGTKAELTAAQRGIGRVATEGDSVLNRTLKTVPRSRGRRLLDTVRGYTPFSLSEAFEEGAQFAIPITIEDYVTKGRDNEENILESLGKGISETFNSKEGMISILSGGLTGGIMERGRALPQGGRGGSLALRDARLKRKATEKFVQLANSSSSNSYLKQGINSLKRAEAINVDLNLAAEANDRLNYEDSRTNQMLNYLLPRIQYGRYDLVAQDIQDYKALAQTEEGWQELQAAKLVDPEISQEDFINNLNRLEQMANQTNEQFEAIQTRYGNSRTTEGQQKYPESVMAKMAFTVAKIEDYSRRISGLLPQVTAQGVEVMTFINSIINKEFNEEDLSVIDDQIDNRITLNREQKTTLKETIADIFELAARRQLKNEEYDELVKNPQLYTTIPESTVTPTADPLTQVPTPEGMDPEEDDLVRELARKIANGEEITDEEDLELQKNNLELLEEYLEELQPELLKVKEQFLTANEGKEVSLDGRTGTLSMEGDRLFFNSDNFKIEVTNQDFTDGTIQGDVVDPGNYLKREDPRTESIPQGRVGLKVRTLLADSEARLTRNQETIQRKKEEIARIEQEIEAQGTEGYFTRNIVSDMIALQEMRRELEDEIELLKQENLEIEAVIAEYSQVTPEYQQDLVASQIDNLNAQALANASLQNALERLLNASSDLLSRLSKKVISRIYSWKKDLIGRPAFDSIVRAIENWEQSNSSEDLNTALQIINQESSLLETLDKRPLTAGEKKWITEKLKVIQERIAQVEPLVRAKQELLDNLKDIQEEIDERQEVFEENKPENFVEEEELVAEVPVPVTTTEPTIELSDLQIPITRAFQSTVVPNSLQRTKGWYPNFMNFMSKLGQMRAQRRSEIRFMTVTRNTESGPLVGLLDKVNRVLDKNGNETDKVYTPTGTDDGLITLVAVKMNSDGTYDFLDKNGEVIKENILDNVVVTKMRSASLVYKTSGESQYAEREGVDPQQELEKYKKERAEILESTTPRFYSFRSSPGVATTNPTPVVGGLISEDAANTEGTLKVVSRGDIKADSFTLTNKDGFKIVVKPGDVVVDTQDVFQKVSPEQLDKERATLIAKTLHYIASKMKEATQEKLDPKLTVLMNFVVGTVGGSFGNNYSTFQIGREFKVTMSPETLDIEKVAGQLEKHHTNVSRKLLEAKKAFNEVTGFETNGEPIVKTWPSYQGYILLNPKPIIKAYKTEVKYAILSQQPTSQTRVEEAPKTEEASKTEETTKTKGKTKTEETKQKPKPTKKDLQINDKVTYNNVSLTTPTGEKVTLSGEFTVLVAKSSGLDTFIDKQGNKVVIPQGVNVVRQNGTNNLYYVDTKTHNKTENKKAYKTITTTPQEFEVEEELPSSDPVMDETAEIPAEVVAQVDETKSVKQGTVKTESTTKAAPTVSSEEKKTTTETKEKPKAKVVKQNTPSATPTLEIGDFVTTATKSGDLETYTVVGLKGSRYVLNRRVVSPTGEELVNEDFNSPLTKEDPFGKKQRFPSVIGNLFLEEKSIAPQITIPEIKPTC